MHAGCTGTTDQAPGIQSLSFHSSPSGAVWSCGNAAFTANASRECQKFSQRNWMDTATDPELVERPRAVLAALTGYYSDEGLLLLQPYWVDLALGKHWASRQAGRGHSCVSCPF